MNKESQSPFLGVLVPATAKEGSVKNRHLQESWRELKSCECHEGKTSRSTFIGIRQVNQTQRARQKEQHMQSHGIKSNRDKWKKLEKV